MPRIAATIGEYLSDKKVDLIYQGIPFKSEVLKEFQAPKRFYGKMCPFGTQCS